VVLRHINVKKAINRVLQNKHQTEKPYIDPPITYILRLNFRHEKYPDTHGIRGWVEPQNRAARNEV
jgi:hypothetical protein